MDSKKIEKLRMHLQAAMDCLGESYEGYGDEKAESVMPGTDDEDDVAANSLKMKMAKYK
jgi:hypothetical protein